MMKSLKTTELTKPSVLPFFVHLITPTRIVSERAFVRGNLFSCQCLKPPKIPVVVLGFHTTKLTTWQAQSAR